MGKTDQPTVLIGQIIRGLLGIIGSLALAVFIYGGFVWMTSAGNSQRVEQGRNTLIWAAIGLTVIFTAYVLVRQTIEALL